MNQKYLIRASIVVVMILIFHTTEYLQAKSFGGLTGRVTDAANNAGLPGVNIYLSNTLMGTSSDKNGNYTLREIPDGTYFLVASMIGYDPVIQKVKIQKSFLLQIDISLKTKPIGIDTVKVTASVKEYEEYLKNLKDYRKIFKKYFLGLTDFTDECIIENIDNIIFNKKENLVFGSYLR